MQNEMISMSWAGHCIKIDAVSQCKTLLKNEMKSVGQIRVHLTFILECTHKVKLAMQFDLICSHFTHSTISLKLFDAIFELNAQHLYSL